MVPKSVNLWPTRGQHPKIFTLFVNSGQREPVRTEPVRTTSSQFGPQASQFGPDLVQTGSRRPWIDPASQFGPHFWVRQFDVHGRHDLLSYLCFTIVLLHSASQFGPLVQTGSHKVVRTGSFRKSWVAQPPWMGFQAVIKSAASAASLETRKNPNNFRKNRKKKTRKNCLFGPFI